MKENTEICNKQQQWVWNGVHSAFVRINEELLERKVAALV
jgi:hypothetical protein